MCSFQMLFFLHSPPTLKLSIVFDFISALII